MRKRKRGRKFGRERDQRHALMAHLASSLILHGKITTTEAKAKELRPYVERLITKARKNNLAASRSARASLDAQAAMKLVRTIGPGLLTRPGGYTRITKLPPRSSDGAKRAIIEIL